MENKLCDCSNLEWNPEHYSLEHHPDCQRVQYSQYNPQSPLYSVIAPRNLPRDEPRPINLNVEKDSACGIPVSLPNLKPHSLPVEGISIETATQIALAYYERFKGQLFPPDPRKAKPDWWRRFEK